MHGITRRTFWIVKEVHSFQSDSLFVTKPDLGGEFIKKVIESQYIGHFLIIGQIIVISLILGSKLKLSVILRNYWQSYRCQKIKENYQEIIIIEKFELSPTPSYTTPHYYPKYEV